MLRSVIRKPLLFVLVSDSRMRMNGNGQCCKIGVSFKDKKKTKTNDKQCRSRCDGSVRAVSSGCTLFTKVYGLARKTENAILYMYNHTVF